MTEGRLKHQWAQTCEVIAAVVNSGFSPPKRAVKGPDLNPYAKRAQAAPTKIPAKQFIEYLALAWGAKKR